MRFLNRHCVLRSLLISLIIIALPVQEASADFIDCLLGGGDPYDCAISALEGFLDTTLTAEKKGDEPRSSDYIKDTIQPEVKAGTRGREAEAFYKKYINKTKLTHPWVNFGGLIGNLGSLPMWMEDSLLMMFPHLTKPGDFLERINAFISCMDPKYKSSTDDEDNIFPTLCEECFPEILPGFADSDCNYPFVNTAFVVDYWWPTNQVEINNFGVSAFDPLLNPTPTPLFSRYALVKFLEIKQVKLVYAIMIQSNLMISIGIVGDSVSSMFDKVKTAVSKYKPRGSSLTSRGGGGLGKAMAGEAHVYQTFLQYMSSLSRTKGESKPGWLYIKIPYINICIPYLPFLYNGFMKGNPDGCFYDTLEPETNIPKMWTEHPYYKPFWMFPTCSAHMNDQGGLFKGSTPTFAAMQGIGSTSARDKAQDWMNRDSCAAYRSRKKGQEGGTQLTRMKDLHYDDGSNGGKKNPFKFNYPKESEENASRWSNCYQGDWQLYPLTGRDFSQSASTGPVLLARRAAELAGMRANCSLTSNVSTVAPNKCGDAEGANQVFNITDHVNKFTRLASGLNGKSSDPDDPKRTEVDKIQILFPRVFKADGEWELNSGKKTSEGDQYPSKCMRMHEFDQLTHGKSPSDILLAKHKGSTRYAIWEKRRACFCPYRGIYSSPELDHGLDTWSFIPGLNRGWGCVTHPANNMDAGRGNVAVESYTRYLYRDWITILCNFPFFGVSNWCAISDSEWPTWDTGPINEKKKCKEAKCKDLPAELDMGSWSLGSGGFSSVSSVENAKPLCEIPESLPSVKLPNLTVTIPNINQIVQALANGLGNMASNYMGGLVSSIQGAFQNGILGVVNALQSVLGAFQGLTNQIQDISNGLQSLDTQIQDYQDQYQDFQNQYQDSQDQDQGDQNQCSDWGDQISSGTQSFSQIFSQLPQISQGVQQVNTLGDF